MRSGDRYAFVENLLEKPEDVLLGSEEPINPKFKLIPPKNRPSRNQMARIWSKTTELLYFKRGILSRESVAMYKKSTISHFVP